MRAMPHLVSAAALALLVAIMPGRAHHAVQAQFDVDQAVEKRGILTKIESLGILGLRRAGIDSKSAFKIGELFTFTINPSRDGSATGLLVTLVFPDGRRYDVRNQDTAGAGG